MNLLLAALSLLTWPLRPGPSFQSGALKLAAWSLLGTTFFLFVGEITFPGGAFQFIDYAKALTQGTGDSRLSARDIGYPLLLLASGYQFSQSFIVVILLQACMAWAIPLLVYGVVGPQHRIFAYLAGLATTVSASPYLFMKMIHHDQLYIFLSLLTIYLATIYLRNYQIRYLYFAMLALVSASLTRPAGNLLVLPLLLLLWIFRPAGWRHYVICGLVASLCIFAYAEHRTHLLGFTMEGNVPSYKGRQIFYNLYVNSADFGIRIDESLGPATGRLFARVRSELKEGGLNGERMNVWYRSHNFPEAAKYYWFTQFTDVNEVFIESLIQHPSHDYFEFFCWVETTDQVFLRSAIEIAKKYPLYPLWIMARNTILFFWIPGYAHGRFGLSFQTFNPEGLQFLPLHGDISLPQIETYVPIPGKYELLKRDTDFILRARVRAARIENVWKNNYQKINKGMFVLATIALVGMFYGRECLRHATAVTWLFFLYNALVTCTFAEPNYRYHFFVLPMLFILAGLGSAFFVSIISRIRTTVPNKYLASMWPSAMIDTIPKSLAPASKSLIHEKHRIAVSVLICVAVSVAFAWTYSVWVGLDPRLYQ